MGAMVRHGTDPIGGASPAVSPPTLAEPAERPRRSRHTAKPIPGPDEARRIAQRCRVALGRSVGGRAAVQDALLLLVCAKGIDETAPVVPRFVVPADHLSERCLADQCRRARRWLHDQTGFDGWPDLQLSRRRARRVLEVLGPWSLVRTAGEPNGAETLQALFAEVAGPSGRLDPACAFARPEPATQLLDAVGFKRRSERLRTVTVAGAKAFGAVGTLKQRNLEWMRGNYRKAELQLTNFPKLIHVELSTHCNLACRTCSITRPGRERDLTYLSMDTLERLRPALPFISDCKLHGGGEPFMHPQIERVLGVFRDEGVRLNTVTNATLIREPLGRLIGETFSSLTVSVDGADKATYEYVRVKATWERLLRGLDHVNRYRNPDLRLIIGVVMLKCNIHQLPDFVRFAKEHGAQEMQAAWLVPFHDLPWTQTQALTDDPVRTNHFMDEARAVGDELGISVRIPDNLPVPGEPAVPGQGRRGGAEPLFEQPAFDEPGRAALDVGRGSGDAGVEQRVTLHPFERGADRAGVRESTIVALDHEATYWDLHGTDKVEGQCRLMYDRAMILVDGTVKPCGQSRFVPDLGSINERSFEACWNGDGYRRLRSTFNSGTLPKTCRSCNFIRSKQLGTARLVY